MSAEAFAPFHPDASHIPPDYRDGWNACYELAQQEMALARLDAAPTVAQLIELTRAPFALQVKIIGEGDNKLWCISGSVPGLLLTGTNLTAMLADVPAAVALLRELNGLEITKRATQQKLTAAQVGNSGSRNEPNLGVAGAGEEPA